MASRQLLVSESRHHRITVDENDGVTSLRFNGCLQSSMRGAEGLDTVQAYLDLLHLSFVLTPDARRVLVIGLGGGVLPKRIWHDYPDVQVDVVELDPQIVEVARRYFDLPQDERLRVTVADGREYVAD